MLFEGCVLHYYIWGNLSLMVPVGLGYHFIHQSHSLVLDAVNDFSIALGMSYAGMSKEF